MSKKGVNELGKYEMNTAEIAELLGVKRSGVKTIMNRAGIAPIRPSTGGSSKVLYNPEDVRRLKTEREKPKIKATQRPVGGRLEEHRADIMTMWADRVPIPTIAEKYGVTRQWMHEVIRSWV